MKNIVIIYHDDQDGFGAAWAAWKKFKNKASYVPMQYKSKTELIVEKIKNKELYLVDLCFEVKVMEELLKNNKKVVVIDHHIGRKEEVKISTDHLFALNNSAAVLSWRYFFPKKKIPALLRHIEDYDIWKFKIPYTRELLASLNTYKFNFKEWDKIAADWENLAKRKKYIIEGKAIIKYQNKLIKKIAGYGEKAVFEGLKTFVVNSPILESEVGNYIAVNKKAVALVWSYRDGLFKGSLRGDGKINLSNLARKYDGGGHKAAAGFTFKAKVKFPWK